MHTLSYKKTKDSVPIARVKSNDKMTSRIVYLNKATDEKNDIKNDLDHDKLESVMKKLKIPSRQRPQYINKIEKLIKSNVDPKSFYSDDELLVELYKNVYELEKDEICTLIQLKGNETFTIFPDVNDINRYYIAGQSKSGKSYVVKDILDNYSSEKPKSPVFLISNLDKDDTLDQTKANLAKIDLNTFLDSPPALEEFADENDKTSMIVFDDYEYNENKKINNCIEVLINSICMRGRHLGGGINAIFCPHNLVDSAKSKVMLNECTNYVVFPSRTVKRKLDYLLSEYAGLEPSQIKYVCNVRSRWVCVNRVFKYAISEYEIKLF